MTTEPTIIRCSALSGWSDCPRRSAARLFRREIEAAGYKLRRLGRGIGALIGSATHRGAEVALTEKAQSGKLPPASVPLDAAFELFHKDRRADGPAIEYDGVRGATHNLNEAEHQLNGLVQMYHYRTAPELQPVIVEQRLDAEVAPGVILSGTPDVVCFEPGTINDLKTGSRLPGSFTPQLGGYSLLCRSHGMAIELGRIDYLRRVSVRRPQPEPEVRKVQLDLAETAAANIVRSIAGDLHTFRQGDPARRIPAGDPWAFSANPSSILCSAKYCPAFGTSFCREGDVNK